MASVIDFIIEETEITEMGFQWILKSESISRRASTTDSTAYLDYVLQIVTIIKQPKRNTTQNASEFPMSMPIIGKFWIERK